MDIIGVPLWSERVELRGIEPLLAPAKTATELQGLLFSVVTSALAV
jgi:hypothetical protein